MQGQLRPFYFVPLVFFPVLEHKINLDTSSLLDLAVLLTYLNPLLIYFSYMKCNITGFAAYAPRFEFLSFQLRKQ